MRERTAWVSCYVGAAVRSLGIILGTLAVTTVASLIKVRKQPKEVEPESVAVSAD